MRKTSVGTATSSNVSSPDALARPLAIGFLHVGPPSHGVLRYGRILAAETARRPDVRVDEVEVPMQQGRLAVRPLRRAARALRHCDVVHLQYNVQRDGCVWGARWHQLLHLRAFLDACDSAVVCTIHDAYPMPPLSELPVIVRDAVKEVFARGLAMLGAPGSGRQARAGIGNRVRGLRRSVSIPGIPLRFLAARAGRLVVCSEQERVTLQSAVASPHVRVIPHFVEERPILPSSDDARRKLGLEGFRIVTLLGYIHPRKGHRLALEAFARLPAEFVLVFAGDAPRGGEQFLQRLLARAQELGIRDRVRVTGYLDEDTLDDYIAATHVPVCPFSAVAGSGSMSTWISAGRMFLSSDLPLVREYNSMATDAIATFATNDAPTLAEAVLQFDRGSRAEAPILALRRALHVSQIVGAHMAIYREALGDVRTLRIPRFTSGENERGS